MRQILSFLGKVFLVFAFLAAAAEVAAHSISSNLGWIASSGEIWAILAPERFAAFTKEPPMGLWQLVLDIPAWALFGIPGFLAILFFHDDQIGEDPELEESLFLYDELAKQVNEGSYEHFGDKAHAKSQDDMDPSDTAQISIADDHYSEDFVVQNSASKHDYLFKHKR